MPQPSSKQPSAPSAENGGNRNAGPFVTAGQKLTEGARAARVAIGQQRDSFSLRPPRKKQKRDRHARTRVGFSATDITTSPSSSSSNTFLTPISSRFHPQQNEPLNWEASIQAISFARRLSTS